MSLHYLMKCQTTHLSWQRQWPVLWSTLIEPGMSPLKSPDLNPVNYAVGDVLRQMAYQYCRFTTVNKLKQAIVTEWGKLPQRLVNRVIGQSWIRRPAAKRTHSTFDRKTVRCDFLDNNWDNKHVVSVVNFLKCVVWWMVCSNAYLLLQVFFTYIIFIGDRKLYLDSRMW